MDMTNKISEEDNQKQEQAEKHMKSNPYSFIFHNTGLPPR
jgi:hypothetical protein